MNQKKILLIVVAALVILLAATYPLYNRLSKENQNNQLMTIPQQEDPTTTTSPTTQSSVSVQTDPTQPEEIQPEETRPPETKPQPTQPPETQPTNPPVTLEYDFTVVDGDGNSVKLSDYVGKPIVLNFWASWCGPCKSEMPEFQQVFEDMGEQVQFLMVNATAGGDTVEKAKSYIRQSGYTFPVLFDTQGNAMHTFGVDAFPTSFFLDKTGKPVGYVVGAISKATLLQGIDMITK